MLLALRKFTENVEETAKHTLKSKQEKQFAEACFCLKSPATTMSKLLHIFLLVKHISFLVFVFTASYRLLPQVDYYRAHHTVSSELMFKSWTLTGVISQR